ncbi:MAG: UDP-2,4-diacetamido-2,4,6-trideoxy-beta-L-altropyranose hydrolase [Lentisphaerae bacterium]|nr:UDP-2,4-diacetamido-2,4,6-trideoxy-beta-L-altropyranose hydrolase [Lentisphaerota bacterium]
MGSITLRTRTLVIRADASSSIGTGHIMRCFALAQSWQSEDGRVVFMSHCEDPTLRQRITNAGMEFISIANPHPDPRDLQTTLEFLRTCPAGVRENQQSKIGNPTWFVLDGYHFDAVYQQAVRAAGYRLLVIDDMAHLPAYHADILLNQNLGAEKLKFNCDPDTTLLLGSGYVLLRKEFLVWRGWQREIPNVARNVLVTMGGGDPDNVTLKVIHALEQVQVDGLEAVVVVGGSNPHYEILQSAIRNLQLKIRLERDAYNIPELMAWADVAITAGGSTCWELAFMGVPSLVIILADNQGEIAESLGRAGVSLNLGWFHQVSVRQIAVELKNLLHASERRKHMSQLNKQLVDGEGSMRVLEAMVPYDLMLRPVREEDLDLLWRWANDPVVRQTAFKSMPIPWEEHQQWFFSKRRDPQCYHFIVLNNKGIPVAQVRFDVSEDETEVSVSVDKEHRGKGYGSLVINLGIKELIRTNSIRVLLRPND